MSALWEGQCQYCDVSHSDPSLTLLTKSPLLMLVVSRMSTSATGNYYLFHGSSVVFSIFLALCNDQLF